MSAFKRGSCPDKLIYGLATLQLRMAFGRRNLSCVEFPTRLGAAARRRCGLGDAPAILSKPPRTILSLTRPFPCTMPTILSTRRWVRQISVAHACATTSATARRRPARNRCREARLSRALARNSVTWPLRPLHAHARPQPPPLHPPPPPLPQLPHLHHPPPPLSSSSSQCPA